MFKFLKKITPLPSQSLMDEDHTHVDARIWRRKEANNEVDAIVLFTLAATGFLANFVMVAAILGQRRLRRMTSAFIVHGCILNVANCAYCIPFGISLTSKALVSVCNTLGSSFIVLMTSTMFNLVAIVCCEVYMFSEINLGGDGTRGSLCCITFGISLVYTGSVILHLGPTLIGGNFEADPSTRRCLFIYGQQKNYIVYVMWVIIVSLALVGAVYYLVIMYRLIQKNSDHRLSSLVRASVSIDSELRDRTRRQNLWRFLQLSMNRACVLTGVTVLHVICWYPLFSLTIVDPKFQFPLGLYKAFTLLGWANAVIEPFVFLAFDRQVNHAFMRRIAIFYGDATTTVSNTAAATAEKSPTRQQLRRESPEKGQEENPELRERIGCRLCHMSAQLGPLYAAGPQNVTATIDLSAEEMSPSEEPLTASAESTSTADVWK